MEDMNSPTTVLDLDVEAKNPPIHESITSVNRRSAADDLNLKDVAEVSDSKSSWEWEDGDIKQQDFTVEAETLGAYDKHGNFYPEAVPEGGIIKIGGIPMKVRYGAEIAPYFEEQGFLSFTQDNSLKIGKVFSWGVFLPDDKYGKAFTVTNYPGLHQGSKEREIFTNPEGENPSVYVALLTAVGYPNDILPDKIENGNKIFEQAKGLPAETSDITETDKVYLALYLGKIIKVGNEFDLEMLGYSKGNEISVEIEALPDDVLSMYMRALEEF